MFETIICTDREGALGIDREALRPAFAERNGRLLAPGFEEAVRNERARFAATELRARPKFRLKRVVEKSGEVSISLGPTDYFDYLATNHNSPLNRALVTHGIETHNDPDAYLSNAIGNVGILTTTDGNVAVLQRSDSVPTFAGYLDLPGGHPEPGDINTRLRDAVALNTELYGSILTELEEEVGIHRADIDGLALIGLIRNLADGRKPEMIFHVSTRLDSTAVMDRYEAEVARPESSVLLLGTPEHFLRSQLKLTTPARAALELWMEARGHQRSRQRQASLARFAAVIVDLDGLLRAYETTQRQIVDDVARFVKQNGDAREVVFTASSEWDRSSALLAQIEALDQCRLFVGGSKTPHEHVLRDLELDGSECLALETTPHGLAIAARAGCTTIGLELQTTPDLVAPETGWRVTSLEELW